MSAPDTLYEILYHGWLSYVVVGLVVGAAVVGDAVDMVFMRLANAALGGQQQIPMKILYNCLYFPIDGWNVCVGVCACMKFIRAIYRR